MCKVKGILSISVTVLTSLPPSPFVSICPFLFLYPDTVPPLPCLLSLLYLLFFPSFPGVLPYPRCSPSPYYLVFVISFPLCLPSLPLYFLPSCLSLRLSHVSSCFLQPVSTYNNSLCSSHRSQSAVCHEPSTPLNIKEWR